MKEQKLYVCEYCGTQYKEKLKASDCEKGHKKVSGINDTRYHAMCDYPDKVQVTFRDGTSIWYKR